VGGVGFLFWPTKNDGSNWISVECSSTDNNTNWGATGACHVNCACNE